MKGTTKSLGTKWKEKLEGAFLVAVDDVSNGDTEHIFSEDRTSGR